MNEQELHEAAVKTDHASAQRTVAAMRLVASVLPATACVLLHPDERLPGPQRDVIIRFNRPIDAEEFLGALKAATNQK